MESDLLEKEDTTTVPVDSEGGDHDLFSHYANKLDIERAVFEGATITALCGKQWTPNRDFTKFPVCPTCKEKYEAMDWREGQPRE